MTATPSTLAGDPGHGELPASLGELGAWRPAADAAPSARPLTLFLTVDTEDAYFDRPHLMTGEGVGREFGVLGVLDELDARSLKATFFVNVYESDRQPAGAVEKVVREIDERGHEVGLHTHPSPTLEFYSRPLFRLERAQQVEVLRWGIALIERWTGAPPTSFRAGGYAIDENTLEALEEVGVEIDSSCFYPSPNNRLGRRFTLNAVAARGALIEVPVTTVLRAGPDGALEHRKLDLDWLTEAQLDAALSSLGAAGSGFAVFMMHSFSFIEKATRTLEEEPSARALFTSGPLFNRYVEVYGPKPALRSAFAGFLDRVTADPAIRVRTLRAALADLRDAAGAGAADVVPIVDRG